MASGIKRITAYTGPKCLLALQENNAVLKLVADKLSCKVPQIEERIEKTLKELKDSKIAIGMIQDNLIGGLKFEKITKDNISYNHCIIDSDTLFGIFLSPSILTEALNKSKADRPENYVFQFDQGFLIYSNPGQAKLLMQAFGWKGGGNEQLCQGKIS